MPTRRRIGDNKKTVFIGSETPPFTILVTMRERIKATLTPRKLYADIVQAIEFAHIVTINNTTPTITEDVNDPMETAHGAIQSFTFSMKTLASGLPVDDATSSFPRKRQSKVIDVTKDITANAVMISECHLPQDNDCAELIIIAIITTIQKTDEEIRILN